MSVRPLCLRGAEPSPSSTTPKLAHQIPCCRKGRAMALLALLALTEGLLGGQSQNHEPAGFGKGMEVWREADLWGREWAISGYFPRSHRNIAQAYPFLGLPASFVFVPEPAPMGSPCLLLAAPGLCEASTADGRLCTYELPLLVQPC